MSRPYISIVVTARNDDHGVNMLGRMQAFVNGWLGQAKRHNLDSELIIVEWNPPADRPPLKDVLRWPSDTSPCEVRFIQVPPEIHNRYRHAQALPLYQMIGKNVGIRRARGEFILATNIDILFSTEFVAFLAERRLEPGVMYRMDRWDVMKDVPVDGTVDEQLEYCRTHVIRLCSREGFFAMDPDGLRSLFPSDVADRDSGIHFGAGWFSPEQAVPGSPYRSVSHDSEIYLHPPSDPPPPLILELGPGEALQAFTLQLCNASGEFLAQTEVSGRTKVELQLPRGSLGLQLFRLRVPDRGDWLAHDPRIICFRVYRCEWGTPAVQPPEEDPSDRDTGNSTNGFHSPTLLSSASPERAPSRLGRLRKFYVDSGGPIGTLLGIRRYQQRALSFVERVEPGQDIFAPDSGIRPANGWHGTEYFSGETFRWVGGQAELILEAGSNPNPSLALQIEPGPGVGSKPFELTVRDQAGKTVATALIEKLRFIEIPLSVKPHRTHVFTLSASGGGQTAPNGDPRILDFRVFWCGLRNNTLASGVDPAARREESLAVGWGAGWSSLQHDELNHPFRTAGSYAEILVRPPDFQPRAFCIDIAPTPGTPRVSLEIRDHEGTSLATFSVDRRCQIGLDLPLPTGRTAVLQLCSGDPSRQQPQSQLRLYSWTWIPVSPPPSPEPTADSSTEITPVPYTPPDLPTYLHVNTCGDFTMLSREDWIALRAYPEFDMYSFHIDSVFCYAAYHGGMREQMLEDPCRCYHIDHSLGSGWSPEGEAKLFSRLQERGIDMIQYSDLVRWIADMRRMRSPLIFNTEEWGMEGLGLPELGLSSTPPDHKDSPEPTPAKPGTFSVAQACWNQRAIVAELKPKLIALHKAANDPASMHLYQAAQLAAAALEFQPDLILELGRGYGNSTCVFTEIANRLGGTRVVSLDLWSSSWEKTLARLNGVVPESWFQPLKVIQANIVNFDFDPVLAGARRVMLFWDAHGFEVASVVLSALLPQLASRDHLIAMHDCADSRYDSDESMTYRDQPLWIGGNAGSSYFRIGFLDSNVEQAVSILDFSTRNGFPLHSADHSLHTELSKHQTAELQSLWGDMFQTVGQWIYFSMKEATRPLTFPQPSPAPSLTRQS